MLSRWSYFVILVLAEARKQVMEATEKLGGQYSPHLHPQCTHLVVQISFLFEIILFATSCFWGILICHWGETSQCLLVGLRIMIN